MVLFYKSVILEFNTLLSADFAGEEQILQLCLLSVYSNIMATVHSLFARLEQKALFLLTPTIVNLLCCVGWFEPSNSLHTASVRTQRTWKET